MFHNHLVMQASAYQNSCFVVATAKAGIEDGCMLIGGSCIVQPSGEIVSQVSSVDDELITYAADLDLAKMGKETVFNYAKHRRIEHYGIIASQTGVELPPELADAAE
jgi:predicted amidohydrolase